MRPLPWLLLFTLLGAAPAHADRDIVYAARYYAPPGSPRTSHFHLYRINPDGTGRTQLTYGDKDDTDPRWSPDGRQIAFVRDAGSVCVADANGSGLRTLAAFQGNDCVSDLSWLPEGQTVAFIHKHDAPRVSLTALWFVDVTTDQVRRYPDSMACAPSPNGHFILLGDWDEDRDKERILNWYTGVSRNIPTGFLEATWLDEDTLVALVAIVSKRSDARVTLAVMSVTGNEQHRVICHWPHSSTDPYADSVDPGTRSLAAYLKDKRLTVYIQDVGNSGTRPDNDYWFADIRTGKMKMITNGQFLVWSPQGKLYCTALMRELTGYGPIVNGYHEKSLYTSPLAVGSLQTGKEKSVTPGLVWVTGADWRERPQ